MKNVAKLVLFLSVSFFGLLLFSGLVVLLHDWTSTAMIFPAETGFFNSFSGKIPLYLRSSIPAAFYISILLGLNYAVRRRIAYPAAFGVILILILVLSSAAFLGLESLERAGFTIRIKQPPAGLVKQGFILNQGTVSGYQTAFLEDPNKPNGAMVQIVQGQPLNYQGQGVSVSRTKLPFFTEKRGIFDNIRRDLEHSSFIFLRWFTNSPWSYAVYAGSLAAFLLSLGCIINISFWSLANLFIGAVVFRGVLALENFLHQGNINDLLSSFAGKIIPPSLINPLIYFSLSVLLLLYSGFVYLARGRMSDG